VGKLLSDRRSRDAQGGAIAGVALNQHAHRVVRPIDHDLPRGRADAAFETETHHTRTAADITLLEGAGFRGFKGGDGMLGMHMKATQIIQAAIEGLGHHRCRGLAKFSLRPLHDAGIHLADGVGVRDADGSVEDTEVLEIGHTGHFAVAIEIEEAAIDGGGAGTAARQYHRNTGSDRPRADLQSSVAADQSDLPDFHARNIGDGIEWPRGAFKGHAHITRAFGGVDRRVRAP
jgi:hypothetical protein